ncbi:protoheme IX farnesyltransferase [Monoraphidium neglectum]|uniref:Heme O synthase n=1 Tax=Monoraphidium neglectum TaxID=145388 RepID=A0A0D2LVJ2_9CHLO|nr:protoheme IX farnesyltransferase [Monoraphidium neglectum]KIY93611.1 protoheme IX farnesyltransferase [Monoraphidium neglectum]|eukprot:XP_013892631.1 protoheme IX farnesyltransferase [Monoraphidium neglectum]
MGFSSSSSGLGAGAGACRRGLATASTAAASSATAAAAAAAAAEAAHAAGRGPKSLARRARALLRDYKQLSKAKLSGLVVLTAAAGFAAGSEDGPLDWSRLGWTSLGTFGAAACANALNQAYERANDALMTRTRGRPLPAGRMGRPHALAFAAAAGAAGLWVLYDKANPLTAALGAANIFLYAGVYTPLKQISVANTWVGAVVGAIPPLMGWAAAAGQLEPAAGVLAAALFFWQMPHFLSLAWLCREDYARGGFKMLSMFDPTGRRTAAAALRHCAYLLPVGFAAVSLGVASEWFAWESAALCGAMGAGAVAFYRAPSQAR